MCAAVRTCQTIGRWHSSREVRPSSITAIAFAWKQQKTKQTKMKKKTTNLARLLSSCGLLRVCGCRRREQCSSEFRKNNAAYSLRQGIHKPISHAEKTPSTRTFLPTPRRKPRFASGNALPARQSTTANMASAPPRR